MWPFRLSRIAIEEHGQDMDLIGGFQARRRKNPVVEFGNGAKPAIDAWPGGVGLRSCRVADGPLDPILIELRLEDGITVVLREGQ